jgi:ABC-type polysaccharide/polyol phosphate export permease
MSPIHSLVTSTSVVQQQPAPGLHDPGDSIAESIPPDARRSILGDFREIAAELRQSRELIYQLTLRDVRIRYKQAVFGFAWAVLIPVAVVCAGLVVRYAVAASAGRPFDRTEIANMAVKSVPWGFFVGSISGATASLLANLNLVTKIYFPREVLPLSTIIGQTFDSSIGAIIVAVLLPFLGVTASVQLLWVPVLIVLFWVFVLAAGLFLSCMNVFFRDVKYLVQVFLMFGIFVTPVILDIAAYGTHISPWMMLNPIAPLLEGLRLSIVEHHNLLEVATAAAQPGNPEWVIWRPWYLAYSAAWAIGGLFFSSLLFHRSERRYAEIV